MPIAARIYGCRFESSRRQEAARARALSWAACELPDDTRHLVLDRRQEQQNLKDRRVLGGLAGRPARFTFEHASADAQPLLWLPDIVVGAAAAHLVYGDDRHLKTLEKVVEVCLCEDAAV
ncbi:hypothetical protein [Thermoactinospora rubra]|uniref:hypothetical protein n=1 Tax=Thermoactinospora rubra TaxID=1088767 RepID=UPI00197CD110|nr:hypothetical protein [Thermoactinospora rubra]